MPSSPHEHVMQHKQSLAEGRLLIYGDDDGDAVDLQQAITAGLERWLRACALPSRLCVFLYVYIASATSYLLAWSGGPQQGLHELHEEWSPSAIKKKAAME
ncbi:hypothetical protein GOP47_0029808 [Adiantum capillus-veneris]|nr:hypothetical protein GOP47_0029808 [Adiantum capillus-veneris]